MEKNGTNVGTNNNSYIDNSLNNGDIISCELSSNAVCATPVSVTSNNMMVVVNPVVTPGLSVVASSTTICAGTPVSFTSTTSNGGTVPFYQWKRNGVNVGTNSNIYTDNTLNNGDVVSCILTSNQVCTTTPTAISNNVTIMVNAVLTPTITVAASRQHHLCGHECRFYRRRYEWRCGPCLSMETERVPVGSNSSAYNSAALNNNDVVTCELTSGYACALPALVTSNPIQLTVDPVLTPAVTISTTDNSICAGQPAVFNAAATNGGPVPLYEWKRMVYPQAPIQQPIPIMH